MTLMTSTRLQPLLLQLLPQHLRRHPLRTRMRSTPRLSKATLPKTHTPSKAILPRTRTPNRATRQRIPMPNRATLRLILTTSPQLCFLRMMRKCSQNTQYR